MTLKILQNVRKKISACLKWPKINDRLITPLDCKWFDRLFTLQNLQTKRYTRNLSKYAQIKSRLVASQEYTVYINENVFLPLNSAKYKIVIPTQNRLKKCLIFLL